MNSLTTTNPPVVPFFFQENEVRTIIDEQGNPLFVAKDVASILGYVDTVNAIKQHCRGVVKHHPLTTSSGVQNVRVIHEPDLYRLIAKSRLASAEKFENWIFEEVLPTIRRTGSYSLHTGGLQTIADKIDRLEKRLDRFRPAGSAIGNVFDFVEECCEHGFDKVIDKDSLYRAYVEFCTVKKERVSSRSHFFMKLYRTDKAYNSTLTRFGRRVKAVRGLALVRRMELQSPQMSLLQ